MSSSLLEETRLLHEEIDRTRAAAVEERTQTGRTAKEKIHAEHRVLRMVDRIAECSRQLVETYEDADGAWAGELASISGPDEVSQFYSRLKQVRDRHRRSAGEIAEPMKIDFPTVEESLSGAVPGRTLVQFSGEEGHGQFLDLHALYEMYLNLTFVVEKITYTEYVATFDQLAVFPAKVKNAGYRKYLEALQDYLAGFRRRATPFAEVDADLAAVDADFAAAWDAGTFPGWSLEERSSGDGAAGASSEAEPEILDLSGVGSAAELHAHGLDRLKSALTALGLKCGGTLEQRAERLFSVKGVPRDQWPKTILAAPAKGSKKKASGKPRAELEREIAHLEARVYHLASVLGETRELTRENVERKQARSAAEIAQEEEAEVADMVLDDEDGDDDDDGEVPYNPKGLPLGWDGKPIPYWLYKLHGLNVRYSCEICGNHVYRGPKNFQQHFKEWRHAHGMRCLGIPNTVHFQNVTLINDAKELWEKLKEKKATEAFQAGEEEEYEDSQGNVVNKKTYEDLRRQGLL